ncbi:hypothetical protein CPB84DRAFT_1842704 [Gymnopilus junonius]|uniref:Uncharacterized protein n=1 Tax=Gymnopilus junonius TaxID=109634 RepID=A0A9P5TTN5_GYMJU|nr:hypothetical protein CPB84DRAFT_1842704 [Gymnopilus junonius]
MSALRRASPYLVAALTGIVSGVYIFKPLVMKDVEQRNKAPNLPNVTTSDGIPKSRDSPDDKDAAR